MAQAAFATIRPGVRLYRNSMAVDLAERQASTLVAERPMDASLSQVR
jgi:hypothetical protein